MAKNNNSTKSAAKEAAKQQAPAASHEQKPQVKNEKKNTTTEVAPVTVQNATVVKNLSPDAKVAYITAIQKERDEIRAANADKVPQTFVDGLSMIAQATILDVAVGEIVSGTSGLGLIISRNEGNYAKFVAMAASLGVTLPSFKSLPAPTKEQLAQAGYSGIDAGQAALVVLDDKSVTKEAKKKKKAEKKIEAKTALDPTKIENDEQLKEQLTMCFLGSEAPVLRVQKAINFYNTYLNFKAHKAENAEEEMKKVKDMSRIDMLREITSIVGECTFAMSGLAHFLNKTTNDTQSPISAFCAYKRAASAAGKQAEADDAFIADVVKILIIWSCTSKISELNNLIAACDENLKTLGKDKKANAAAIKTEQTFKQNHESEILGYQSIIDCVNQPNFDVVASLAENYNGDEGVNKTAIARRIVSNIIDTYYPGTKLADYEQSSLLKVAQQHAGIILNLFCNPLEQNAAYAEDNISVLVKKGEGTAEEEKPAKGEAKNE